MPKHTQVATCLKGGGPLSTFCSCNHCTLAVCSVCGAYEGSLTTDCPGETVGADRQREVYETNLDYSDARGWHQGGGRWPREPHFETAPVGEGVPPRPRVDREILRHDLEQKAIAWARADLDCEDKSAELARAEEAVARATATLADHEAGRLLQVFEQAKIAFHVADDRAQRCDDEFRQAARKIAEAISPEGVARRDRA